MHGGCVRQKRLIHIFSAGINSNPELQLRGDFIDVLVVAEADLDLLVKYLISMQFTQAM
jgi:hypothetical protein